MENFETAVRFITKDCFMASLDLKDAYFSVPIHKSSQKYLRFRWKGQIWQFKALPNGLSPGPRIFTKILKVPMAALRSLGHIIIPYIDDTLLIAQSRLEALHALKDTIEVLSRLGFSIHPQKSVLEPCHEIKFLGFIINSKEMMITLTEPKVKEIREFSVEMLTKNKAQRMQTIHLLKIDQLKLCQSSASFYITGLVKQSRPGNHQITVKLQGYPQDERICVMNTLHTYLERTAPLRGSEKQLFISYRKPYLKVSKDTLARWVKTVLVSAGIDGQFKAHSTRAAAASAAEMKNVPVSDVLDMAGWAKEATFQRFYKKPVAAESSFATAVLDS
ncbi:hypothetical protein HOLleu_13988 [Holothuria leucospilota]|uniref:Reverse transcriptase domain-containing protein n=1 Tax=Holothuria leucospilota TaxID=206669 RepID=A0A9Q1HBD4_HOLLE|nr:hypothetical protein HOLleu_13988 [Holothuria leucospilota]